MSSRAGEGTEETSGQVEGRATVRHAISARVPKAVKASGKDYLVIALGTLLTAIALDAFLVPGQLAAGGASGLATINNDLQYWVRRARSACRRSS